MKKDRQFVEVDHTNKQDSRLGVNPNRAKRQTMQREAATLLIPPRVAVLESKPKKNRDE